MSYTAKLTPEQKQRAALIAKELKAVGITNPYVIAGVLAVVSKESNFLRLKEVGYQGTSNQRIRAIFGSRVAKYNDAQLTSLKSNPAAFFEAVYGKDSGVRLGNTLKGEGYKYLGRGYNQLTGKANYAAIAKQIGVDIVANPELMETPPVAAKAIAAYFINGINALVKSGTFYNRYKVKDSASVKDAKTGVDVAYDINAGSAKQKFGDTTGGYATATSRVNDFVANLTDFVVTNPVKSTGAGLALILVGVGAYMLSKGTLPKII
jgi:putative chitinase